MIDETINEHESELVKAKAELKRMELCATVMGAFSRMLLLQKSYSSLTDETIQEHIRLKQWWSHLGEEKQEKVEQWMKEFSPIVEDVTVALWS